MLASITKDPLFIIAVEKSAVRNAIDTVAEGKDGTLREHALASIPSAIEARLDNAGVDLRYADPDLIPDFGKALFELAETVESLINILFPTG